MIEKVHFKLYKDGKKWVVAGVAVGIMTLYGGTTVLADTTNVPKSAENTTAALSASSSATSQTNSSATSSSTTSAVTASNSDTVSNGNSSSTKADVGGTQSSSSDTKAISAASSVATTPSEAKNVNATSAVSSTGSEVASSVAVGVKETATASNALPVAKPSVRAMAATVNTEKGPTVVTDAGTSFPAVSGQMNALFETNVTMDDSQVIHVGDQIVWQLPTGKWDYSKFSILGSALNYGTLTTNAKSNQAIYTFDKINSDLTGASLNQGKFQFYLHYVDTAWTVDTTTTYGDVTGFYKSGTNTSPFSVTNSDVVVKPASETSPSALRPIAGGYGYYGYLPDKDNYLQGETYWPSQDSMSFNVVMNPDNAFTNDTNVLLNFSTSSGVKFNTDGFYYVTENGIMNKLNVTTNSDGSVSLKFPVMTGIYYDKILFSIVPGSTNPNITYMTKITYSSDQHPTGSLSEAVNPIYIPAMFVNANTKGFIPFVSANNKSLNNSTDTVSDIDSWLLNGVTASDVEDNAKGLTVPVVIKKDANYNALVQAINGHENGTYQVTFVATDSDGNVSNQIELSDGTFQSIPNGTITVTLYSNILLHFVDGSGKQIQSDVTLNGQAGKNYNTNSYSILVGSDGKVYSLQNPTSGTFGENGQPTELTLNYSVQQWALDASDVTHYVDDPVPGNGVFNVKASDATGNDDSAQVIINTSSVNWNVPGQYVVLFTLPRDNSLGGNIVITRSVYVKANQKSLIAQNYTMHVGDAKPTVIDFGASAQDRDGNAEAISIDFSQVNWDSAGVYNVVLSTADGQSKTVTLTLLANQKSISGQSYTMHVGDPKATVSDFKASATDIDGKIEAVIADFSQVNWDAAGVYNVALSTADGQSKTVTLTLLANQKSISGQDYTMHVGDPKATVSDFKASSTDIDGKTEAVTADFSQVNWDAAGVYNVALSTADGQSKTVTLTLLAKKDHNNGDGNDNNHGNHNNQGGESKPRKENGNSTSTNTSTNNSIKDTVATHTNMNADTVTTMKNVDLRTITTIQSNKSAASEVKLPQTGDSKDDTSVLGVLLISLTGLLGLFGIRRKK